MYEDGRLDYSMSYEMSGHRGMCEAHNLRFITHYGSLYITTELI